MAVEPIWAARERKLLLWLWRREEASDEPIVIDSDRLATELDLPVVAVRRAMQRLHDARYVEGEIAHAINDLVIYSGVSLGERGLRDIGAWPTDPTTALVAVLEEVMLETDDPEERSRLEAMRDAALGLGRNVIEKIVGAWGVDILGPPTPGP